MRSSSPAQPTTPIDVIQLLNRSYPRLAARVQVDLETAIIDNERNANDARTQGLYRESCTANDNIACHIGDSNEVCPVLYGAPFIPHLGEFIVLITLTHAELTRLFQPDTTE